MENATMTSLLKKIYLPLIAAALLFVACEEDSDNNPTNNDTGENPTFDWILEFEFSEDQNYEDGDVFVFDNGETYKQLPIYLFNPGVLDLNSYDEPVLTDRVAVFEDTGEFSVSRNWDMGDAASTYSNRTGAISIEGKFGANDTFEFLLLTFDYTSIVSTSDVNGTLTEEFMLHLSDVPYEVIGDEVHISVDREYLETHIDDIEYKCSIPSVGGNKVRNIKEIDWDFANTVGMHLDIVFSLKADS